jgi:hypothetical protein
VRTISARGRGFKRAAMTILMCDKLDQEVIGKFPAYLPQISLAASAGAV